MLDPHLTYDAAVSEIEKDALSSSTRMPGDVIALCREASDLRNTCFKSEESYKANNEKFQSLLTAFREKFESTVPFAFLIRHIGTYANSGSLQHYYSDNIRDTGAMLLSESISNAMVLSDDVTVHVKIGRKGLLFDVNQGDEPFEDTFVESMKCLAERAELCVANGATIQDMFLKVRGAMRRTIGYIPPHMNNGNGIPYRGNGTSAYATNDFYRTNFVERLDTYHTITLHTREQLEYADKFRKKDKNAARNVYKPSSMPLNPEVVDAIFEEL